MVKTDWRELYKHNIFKITKNLDGDWVIKYKKYGRFKFFIRTIKEIDDEGIVTTKTFTNRESATYFLKRIANNYNSISDYNEYIKKQLIQDKELKLKLKKEKKIENKRIVYKHEDYL